MLRVEMEKEVSARRQQINTLFWVGCNRKWRHECPIDDSDPVLFPFLKKFNKQYTLGFDTVIQNIEQGIANPFGNTAANLTTHTFSRATISDDDIKNGIAEEPTGHLSDPEDEDNAAGQLSFRAKSITVTEEDKHNLHTWRPKSSHLDKRDNAGEEKITGRGMFQILGSPWFMGVITLSVAGIAYTYWRNEKDKKSEYDEETDSDESTNGAD